MPVCVAVAARISTQPVGSWLIKAIEKLLLQNSKPSAKKKNSPGHFDKFAKKKSNAAIKEQFKQEKRKWKKDREDFFEKKRQSAVGGRQSTVGNQQSVRSHQQAQDSELRTVNAAMPLNKFIAHCGICSRRDAEEF